MSCYLSSLRTQTVGQRQQKKHPKRSHFTTLAYLGARHCLRHTHSRIVLFPQKRLLTITSRLLRFDDPSLFGVLVIVHISETMLTSQAGRLVRTVVLDSIGVMTRLYSVDETFLLLRLF